MRAVRCASYERNKIEWITICPPAMKFCILFTILATSLRAQDKGLWQGYNGEWDHVLRQLIALAEATPQEKFSWRPAAGVRSTGEVYMHIALSNFMLLGATGMTIPADAKREKLEQQTTSKSEIISWLKRSLEAVQTNRATLTSAQLARRVKIANTTATIAGIYLRIIIHANEHVGQLIAYARMNWIVPPWS